MMLLLAISIGTTSGAPPCPATLPPAPVAVAGFGTSMSGCIGAQRFDTTRKLAWTVNCSSAGLNLSRAAEQMAAVCADTPACAAFSIDSVRLGRSHGELMCEIHPDTIAQGSELNPDWNVWQKSGAPKPGQWPYPVPSPLAWTTPSKDVTESMPLGNGKLGINVWADASDTVWLLLSHVDALDENTNLDKLGRVAVRATAADGSRLAAGPAPALSFRQEMFLANATVHIDLPSGVSVDVWVDATTDAVRVASTSNTMPHKLSATLEVWRNTSSPIPWCPGAQGSVSKACPQGDLQGCHGVQPGAAEYPAITLHADVVKSAEAGIFFYHRNLEEWITEDWHFNLGQQQVCRSRSRTLPSIHTSFHVMDPSHPLQFITQSLMIGCMVGGLGGWVGADAEGSFSPNGKYHIRRVHLGRRPVE